MIPRIKLSEARRMRGYSQEYMADKIGCHRITYAKMEENPENISMKDARIISEILQLGMDDLIFFDCKSTKCRDDESK